MITGGSGFIGSHIINELKDYDFISLDVNEPKITSKNCKFVKGSILDEDLLKNIMKDVDIIIHLAGIKGESNCLKNPTDAIISNIIGTEKVVKQAKLNNISEIIFASSIYSYSAFKNLKNPIKESYNLEPDSLYGSLKASCEKIVQDSGVPYIILRLSNVYGKETRGGAIGNFVSAIENDSNISIFDEGKNKIDYLNISDLTEAIKQIVKLEIKNEIYNLGGNLPISISDLARLSINTAKQIKINYNKEFSNQKTENRQFADLWLDINKAKKELNWEPKIKLNEGIKEMLK